MKLKIDKCVYSRMVTLAMVHYIVDLPAMLVSYFATIWMANALLTNLV